MRTGQQGAVTGKGSNSIISWLACSVPDGGGTARESRQVPSRQLAFKEAWLVADGPRSSRPGWSTGRRGFFGIRALGQARIAFAVVPPGATGEDVVPCSSRGATQCQPWCNVLRSMHGVRTTRGEFHAVTDGAASFFCPESRRHGLLLPLDQQR